MRWLLQDKEHVSEELIEFIEACLVIDPTMRMTA